MSSKFLPQQFGQQLTAFWKIENEMKETSQVLNNACNKKAPNFIN